LRGILLPGAPLQSHGNADTGIYACFRPGMIDRQPTRSYHANQECCNVRQRTSARPGAGHYVLE